MKKMRVDKVLSNLGYGSRKEIKEYVKKGTIFVNDVRIKDSGLQIDPEKDKLVISGKEVSYKKWIYIMMNKPQGVISSTEDTKEKTVVDLLSKEYLAFQPFPVGRLDKDTEGFLLLTNDGELAHNLLSPKKHVPKKYFAKVRGKVTKEDQEAFADGVVLEDGYQTLPAELSILKSEDISEIELILHEGKFHQVKRMFEAVNKKVIYLKRISMGALDLDPTLSLGEYRELKEEELALLK